jgi:hypothetical protein
VLLRRSQIAKGSFDHFVTSVSETDLVTEHPRPLELGEEDDNEVYFYKRPFEIETLYVAT